MENQFLDLSGRMGHMTRLGTTIQSQVQMQYFKEFARPLVNGQSSCTELLHDQCIYSTLEHLMRAQTEDNCTVPWVRDNANICTKPKT